MASTAWGNGYTRLEWLKWMAGGVQWPDEPTETDDALTVYLRSLPKWGSIRALQK